MIRPKKLKTLGFLSGLVVLTVLLSTYLFLDTSANESTMKFDKAVWLSAWQTSVPNSSGSGERKHYPRKAMLGDLLEGSLLKPGMKKSAVTELMGQGKEFHDGHVVSYLIGPSDWSIDFENLVIEFDANKKLTKHYLWAYDSPPPYPYEGKPSAAE